MLPQVTFLLEANLFQHPCGCQVMGENMGGDPDQAKLRKGELADSTHHGGHDTMAPEWLGQPVADFRSMRFANLKAVKPAAPNEQTIIFADGLMDRPPLLLSPLLDYFQPFLKIGIRVGVGNA